MPYSIILVYSILVKIFCCSLVSLGGIDLHQQTHQVEYNADKFHVADVECVIQCEMEKMEAVRHITDDTQRLRVSLLIR